MPAGSQGAASSSVGLVRPWPCSFGQLPMCDTVQRESPEFKKPLDNAFRHRVWIWSGPLCGQELDSVILPARDILWF